MSISFARGATIPELVIMITVVAILAGILFVPFNDLYANNSRGLNAIVQTADTRAALRMIERDVTYASKFLSENNVTELSGNIPGKASDLWAWTGNPSPDPTKRVLITEAYGTTAVDSSIGEASREIVFNTSNCSQQIPLTINFVYFVSDNKLYKRTLKKTAVNANNGCASKTIGQKRSCMTTYSNSLHCEAADVLIANDVTGFDVHYYLNSSSPSPINEEYTDGTTLMNAKTVVLTITTTTGTGNNAKSLTANLRITRIN